MPARFHELEVAARLKDKRRLSAFLDGLIHQHLEDIRTIRLNYIFCTDEYLLQINRSFLNHDTLTDIITFDLSNADDELLGEIYISTGRVAENARIFNVSYLHELHRVIFHGALHLCGFGDKTEAEAQEMRRQEDLCLNQYLNEPQ
jgi:probable rRNA maturation factor